MLIFMSFIKLGVSQPLFLQAIYFPFLSFHCKSSNSLVHSAWSNMPFNLSSKFFYLNYCTFHIYNFFLISF